MRVAVAIAAFALPFAVVPAAAADDLDWKRGVPGTRGFLSDNGGGASIATVCDTVAEYARWRVRMYGTVAGCHSFPRGSPVELGPILPDPARLSGGLNYPVLQVLVGARRYAGYLNLLNVTPVIPVGTVIRYGGVGIGRATLDPKMESGSAAGDFLNGPVAVRVLRYVPTSGADELFVQVLDGQAIGKKGWMSTRGGETVDGKPVGIFDKMVAAANAT